MNENLILYLFILASFPISTLVVYSYIRLALKLNLLSIPHKGGVRQDSIPTSGGLAFGFLYFIILIFFSNFIEIDIAYRYSILLGASVMTLLGFLDDMYELSSFLKLISQFLFMFLIGYIFDSHIWLINNMNINNLMITLLYFFGSIWLINTFNFIDGADGLVSANSIIFSLVAGSLLYLENESALAFCFWLLTSINLGFLVFNWAPARIFMGDSGSLFLGCIFVILIIGTSMTTEISIWLWLILFSIFYVETTVTLFIRIWRKENAFSVHHSLHAYQRQVIDSGDHSRPAKISILINILWTIPLCLTCYFFPNYGPFITFLCCIPLGIVFYIFGPYQTLKNGEDSN